MFVNGNILISSYKQNMVILSCDSILSKKWWTLFKVQSIRDTLRTVTLYLCLIHFQSISIKSIYYISSHTSIGLSNFSYPLFIKIQFAGISNKYEVSWLGLLITIWSLYSDRLYRHFSVSLLLKNLYFSHWCNFLDH